MRWFLNDDDGLSMTDFLALLVVLTYLGLTLTGALLPQYSATVQAMLGYLNTPMTIVLTGYFGKEIVDSIPAIKNKVTKIKTALMRRGDNED